MLYHIKHRTLLRNKKTKKKQHKTNNLTHFMVWHNTCRDTTEGPFHRKGATWLFLVKERPLNQQAPTVAVLKPTEKRARTRVRFFRITSQERKLGPKNTSLASLFYTEKIKRGSRALGTRPVVCLTEHTFPSIIPIYTVDK